MYILLITTNTEIGPVYKTSKCWLTFALCLNGSERFFCVTSFQFIPFRAYIQLSKTSIKEQIGEESNTVKRQTQLFLFGGKIVLAIID